VEGVINERGRDVKKKTLKSRGGRARARWVPLNVLCVEKRGSGMKKPGEREESSESVTPSGKGIRNEKRMHERGSALKCLVEGTPSACAEKGSSRGTRYSEKTKRSPWRGKKKNGKKLTSL